MKQIKSTSNPKKKTRISKTIAINENLFGKKDKIPNRITQLKNELNSISRYNTLNINDFSKQDNEQNENLNDFEIEKIQSKNLSKFKFRNNNTIIPEEKKYIKLNEKKSNNNNNHRNNSNITQLINGGNNKNNQEKYKLKIALNNNNPIKLRKINTNVNKNYLLEDNNPLCIDKNLDTINTTINTINYGDNKISKSKKDDEIISKLKEEIQKLKQENENDDKIINELKNQLNDNKEGILSEDSEDSDTNEENKIDQNILNSIEENEIFKKLRANYFYNKLLINQLTNQNSELKIKIINRSNNIIRRGNSDENQINNIRYKIKKECNFNTCHKENEKNDINETNNSILNNYVENKLKLNHRDCFMIKQLDNVTKNKIKLMLQMIIISNDINKEDIINLFMNNLLDYYKTVELFASNYLQIKNSPDIKVLKNYFKSVFFDSQKKFNINNAFNTILSFFDEDIKKFEEINILEIYNNNKNIIHQLLTKCKKKDILDTGLIEIDLFKNIFSEFIDKIDSKFEKELIFNSLLYYMKKKENNNEQIGLFFLSYQNLCNHFKITDILNNNLDGENEKNSNYPKSNKSKYKRSKFY